MDATIDRFGALREEDPAFRAVLANFQLYGVYAEADKALHSHTIERVAAMVRHYAPAAPPGQRKVVATVVVEIYRYLAPYVRRGAR